MSTGERVRALLVTPGGELLTIKRTFPGVAVPCCAPCTGRMSDG